MDNLFEVFCPLFTLLIAVRLAYVAIGVFWAYVVGIIAIFVLLGFWTFSFRRCYSYGPEILGSLIISESRYGPPILSAYLDVERGSARCFRLFCPFYILLVGIIAWRRVIDKEIYFICFLDLNIILAYGFACNQLVIAVTSMIWICTKLASGITLFCSFTFRFLRNLRRAATRLFAKVRSCASSVIHFLGSIRFRHDGVNGSGTSAESHQRTTDVEASSLAEGYNCASSVIYLLCSIRFWHDGANASDTSAESHQRTADMESSSSAQGSDVPANAAETETFCCICIDAIERSSPQWQLPTCTHIFHVECIGKWLETHSTCPVCRSVVDTEAPP